MCSSTCLYCIKSHEASPRIFSDLPSANMRLCMPSFLGSVQTLPGDHFKGKLAVPSNSKQVSRASRVAPMEWSGTGNFHKKSNSISYKVRLELADFSAFFVFFSWFFSWEQWSSTCCTNEPGPFDPERSKVYWGTSGSLTYDSCCCSKPAHQPKHLTSKRENPSTKEFTRYQKYGHGDV